MCDQTTSVYLLATCSMTVCCCMWTTNYPLPYLPAQWLILLLKSQVTEFIESIIVWGLGSCFAKEENDNQKYMLPLACHFCTVVVLVLAKDRSRDRYLCRRSVLRKNVFYWSILVQSGIIFGYRRLVGLVKVPNYIETWYHSKR